ncbi:hypothetical protein EVJ58_g3283 [Rhodofomes roseus]|uniref:Endonuclease/exonuclease/phosphatase domain-containing protein n=1 Tax=Rhodofomes roseus TaxID=34475 RepID=A0A4Y9YLS6_9APHY|nr:hypothetical protein EVJ58_g3283 [Rhodofomes roseus]
MMSPPASSGQRPRGSLEYEQRRPAADELLDAPVNWDTVDYVIDCVVWAVSYACYDGETWLAPMLKTAFFCDFAQSIIRRSGVPVPVILTCLAYVEKASRVMEPMPIDWACERVFLGALLLAARSTAEYRHYDDSWWARLTGVLSASDVGNIDYDFRQLIGYDFQVHEHDVIKHCDAIVDRCGQQAGYWSNPPFAEDRLRYTQHASPMGSRPGRFTTRWLVSNWNEAPPTNITVTPPPSIHLVSWNVDFMAPNANARLQHALDHIRSTLEQQGGGSDGSLVPCCVLLQEVEGNATPIILKSKWVREHFVVVPTSPSQWPSTRYGNVTLVSNTVPIVGAQSLVFANSFMGRNALCVDVQLARPGEEESALLRIANVHLESMPEGTSRRPAQLSATAELLRDPSVQAGVVAGDMNPIDPRDANLPAEVGLTDAYQGAEDDEASFTWGYQPRNRFPVCRMDKILYTKHLSLVVDAPSRIGVGVKTSKGQWASDHYGLMTIVKFREQ